MGDAEVFPNAAIKAGKVMGPLQMMTAFSLLSSAEDHDQFVNASTWLFQQLKKDIVGRELLRTYTETAKESIHRDYQHSVLNAVGTKVMGAAEWTKLLLGSLKEQNEASHL